VFVVTGGGSGIGRALAHALAKRNQTVIIIGRRASLLSECAADFPTIQTLSADLSAPEGQDSVARYLKDIPHISALVHNAALLGPLMPIHDLDVKSWQQTWATNLEAPLFLTQRLLGQLTHGRVLMMSSGAAHQPFKGMSSYCISKAALWMATQCWQLENPQVAFASVKPGIVDTAMQASLRAGEHLDPSQLVFYNRLKKTHQLVSPETVAEFLVWLLLDTHSEQFSAKEWDIYDTHHHAHWLKSPHQVPVW
jgi:benzil reductase ((S)-benzoin forming)